MQNALHLKTTVLPGGRIEVADQAFPAGEEVEVIVLLPASPTATRRSAVDIWLRLQDIACSKPGRR